MQIEIKVEEGEYFKLVGVKVDDGDIATTPIPEEVVTVEPVPVVPAVVHSGPKPVPLNNVKSTGMGWFEGTSWSTNNK